MSHVIDQVRLTWETDTHSGEIDCPTMDNANDPKVIERCARRAFWSLISAGYGDIEDTRIYHRGVWVPMDPQK